MVPNMCVLVLLGLAAFASAQTALDEIDHDDPNLKQKGKDYYEEVEFPAALASDLTGTCMYFEEVNGGKQQIASVPGLTCLQCYLSCRNDANPLRAGRMAYSCPRINGRLTRCKCNYRTWDGGNYFLWSIEGGCDNVYGDPHFVGFDGTNFEFQGYAGGYFNVYSDAAHQINVGLDNFNMDDQTFIRSLGFKYGKSARVKIFSDTDSGEQARLVVEVNGRAVFTNSSVINTVGDLIIEVGQLSGGSEVVLLTSPALQLKVTKRSADAKHLNMNLALQQRPLGKAQGVLGQTLQWVDAGKQTLRDEADFVVSDEFADDFADNRFVGGEVQTSTRKLLSGRLAQPLVGKFGGC